MSDTVKFWTFVNDGPVKLKMRAGDQFWHKAGGDTDEGYSWEYQTWEFDGEEVHLEAITTALDCDGKLDTFYTAKCQVSELSAGSAYLDEPSIAYPAWKKVYASQRDYAAEAMGY